MGNFANQVQSFNGNGLHFFNGAIGFKKGDGNYDAGNVSVFSSGQQGSFWYSATNNRPYISRTAGGTTTLGVTGPI